jgi:hypothetical protein
MKIHAIQGWALCCLLGCAEDLPSNPASRGTAPGATESAPAAQANAASLGGDRRSAPELIVRWDRDVPEHTASTVDAIIENRSKRTIDARLMVLVMARSGERRQVPVKEVTLPASTSESVTIDVQALPLQTAGVSSTVMLQVEWSRSGNSTSAGEQTSTTLRNRSFTRHLTWDRSKNFTQAVIRTDDAQIRVDTGDHAKHGAALEAMRLRDEASGALRDVEITGDLANVRSYALGGDAAAETPATDGSTSPNAGTLGGGR